MQSNVRGCGPRHPIRTGDGARRLGRPGLSDEPLGLPLHAGEMGHRQEGHRQQNARDGRTHGHRDRPNRLAAGTRGRRPGPVRVAFGAAGLLGQQLMPAGQTTAAGGPGLPAVRPPEGHDPEPGDGQGHRQQQQLGDVRDQDHREHPRDREELHLRPHPIEDLGRAPREEGVGGGHGHGVDEGGGPEGEPHGGGDRGEAEGVGHADHGHRVIVSIANHVRRA